MKLLNPNKIKSKLYEVLGKNKDEYNNKLNLYINGEITKTEFQDYIESILPASKSTPPFWLIYSSITQHIYIFLHI